MEKLHTDVFFSGLSGLQLNIPKYQFPESFQNASRLTYYSSLFNSIEINSSFYKIPQSKTVAKWAGEVSPQFRFTFKLYKEITHNKDLEINKDVVEHFFKSIHAVGEKKGCVLIQFPPGIDKDYLIKLNSLLKCIHEAEGNDWKIAVEFRNKSWYNDATYNLLNMFNSTLVMHDIPKSATPMIDHQCDFLYIRFHGPTGNYRDSYPENYLSEYATYVNEWINEGKKVFMYFNNTMGDAFNNLKMINRFINANVDIIK
jgi:uncharacterized protein YecE (DUF72 family)